MGKSIDASEVIHQAIKKHAGLSDYDFVPPQGKPVLARQKGAS